MIKLIVVGKLKEKYLVDAFNEYLKRLSRYTKLEVIELPDESFDDVSKVLKNEASNIKKYINMRDYIITLEIDGEEMSSVELSKLIDKKSETFNLTFIIGGSYGIDDSIKEISNCSLSFSKLTFPHQLFRIMLLEQIYRSYKIIKNESYHK